MGLSERTPATTWRPPQNDTDERSPLKSDRIHTFVGKLDVENEASTAYFIAITMGLRRGEVCALSWGDVNFDTRVVGVTHNYDHFLNLKEAKTKAGFQQLLMPEFVSQALLKHKTTQKKWLAQYSRMTDEKYEQADETPVIRDRGARRVNPDNLGAWWCRDRESFGLDGWCLHELCHSHLSMLAEEGMHPEVMQELAGHASSKTTMCIYTHVNMDIKRAATNGAARSQRTLSCFPVDAAEPPPKPPRFKLRDNLNQIRTTPISRPLSKSSTAPLTSSFPKH